MVRAPRQFGRRGGGCGLPDKSALSGITLARSWRGRKEWRDYSPEPPLIGFRQPLQSQLELAIRKMAIARGLLATRKSSKSGNDWRASG